MNKNILKKIIDEIKMSDDKDIRIITGQYMRPFFQNLYKNSRYNLMCVFEVDNNWYYSVIVNNGKFVEPHFGTFNISIEEFRKKLIRKEYEEVLKMMGDCESLRKDAIIDKNLNMIKIMRKVINFLLYYIKNYDPIYVRITGQDRKYNIYKKLLLSNLDKVNFRIISEDKPYKYIDCSGKEVEGKCIELRNNMS